VAILCNVTEATVYDAAMFRFALLLTATLLALSSCAPATVAAFPGDGNADGRLSSNDPRLDSGEFFESYSYAGQAGQLLTISLQSSEFDPYLMMLDPEGEKVAEIDDSIGHGHNIVLSINLAVTGSYTIVVTSFEPGESGSFSLKLSSGSSGTPAPAPHAPAPIWQPSGAA
jgi:hypothetical protein